MTGEDGITAAEPEAVAKTEGDGMVVSAPVALPIEMKGRLGSLPDGASEQNFSHSCARDLKIHFSAAGVGGGAGGGGADSEKWSMDRPGGREDDSRKCQLWWARRCRGRARAVRLYAFQFLGSPSARDRTRFGFLFHVWFFPVPFSSFP